MGFRPGHLAHVSDPGIMALVLEPTGVTETGDLEATEAYGATRLLLPYDTPNIPLTRPGRADHWPSWLQTGRGDRRRRGVLSTACHAHPLQLGQPVSSDSASARTAPSALSAKGWKPLSRCLGGRGQGRHQGGRGREVGAIAGPRWRHGRPSRAGSPCRGRLRRARHPPGRHPRPLPAPDLDWRVASRRPRTPSRCSRGPRPQMPRP
jgi:hypothetical protein